MTAYQCLTKIAAPARMDYITIYDYLLLLVYLFFFYFLITLKSKKYEGTDLKKYLIIAFFLHAAGSVAYCMVIQYYYNSGDSLGFYEGSNFIRKAISATGDPFTPFFMSGSDFEKLNQVTNDSGLGLPTGIYIDSNLVVMKISALLSYLSFNSYLIISLLFGLFTFTGLWKLYRTLNEISGKKVQQLLAYTVLYTPSICFWGSGLIKDSICLGAIGFIGTYIYRIFIKKKFSFREPLLLLLFFYLLFVIKTYLASAFLVSLVLAYVLNIIIKNRKHFLKLIAVAGIVIIIAVILTASLSSNLNSIIEDSKLNIETFKGAYANSDGNEERSMVGFSTANIDIDLPNIILRSPLAVFTTLYRPFLWESGKPIVFLSALESALILLATLYLLIKCRIGKFFYYIFTDPYLFFCFIFCIILGIIIGFSTFNFGTLVRYRLPMLPFYFFMLLKIYIKNKEARVLKN